jgi:methylthioribose-1-phosphate isomerase
MRDESKICTMYWENNCLFLLDQRLLPHKAEYRSCSSYREVISAIKNMTVRGAPAIGISAAYGLAIAAREAHEQGLDSQETNIFLEQAASEIAAARPTAVNLFWALNRLKNWLADNRAASRLEVFKGLESEALAIHREDMENNRAIGCYGAELVAQKASILTHCNAGALATGGYGTALGVIRAANEQGKAIHVYVDETRPLLQGARITAYELYHEGIDATLVTDNCAGHLMALGKIDLVVVGADRIAANGDTANKIGTYSLAVLAAYHEIPFYVAAPLSTIDPAIENGTDIVIEERDGSEVIMINSNLIAPDGINAFNPAFDVTPAKLITAIITEKGVIKRPDRKKISDLFNQ